MSTKKGLWVSLGLVILCLVAGMVFLLQPSGQMSDFQKWQYQASEKASTSSSLNVKFFGVSTLLFDDGKTQILIDGFFSRPSLSQVLFQKIQSQPAIIQRIIQQQQLQRTQAILVTHSHYDHTLDLAELGKRFPHTKIIGSSSTLNIARGGHVAEQQLIQVQPLQPMSFGKFKVTAIPSRHTPPTAVNNDLGEEISQPLQQPARFSEFKEGHSFDYLIEHQGHTVLVKASTGAVPDQLKNLKVDTLFLGIAQLSRQSKEFQQNYLDQSLRTLKPKVVIPIHWDDFFKPVDQPLEFLPYLADNTNKSLRILIQAAEQQKTQVILLSQPVSYPIDTALQFQP
ncbi:MBL fold metallo-hydrolase [Acinetobacter sp. ANC 5378]|uniref:MBL fold metallo-hydrolase n=1 Tax=Acinetobacter sp. ANC 5378 TaxID=2731249 RepID=UPI00148FAD02|nr:MBL fold metallo-hydrolase [Acinetobacter sp. ANC 5378]NNG82732.1 MBL fold metallo-hydrolase [Acinetobacter sp. ANC 5378]